MDLCWLICNGFSTRHLGTCVHLMTFWVHRHGSASNTTTFRCAHCPLHQAHRWYLRGFLTTHAIISNNIILFYIIIRVRKAASIRGDVFNHIWCMSFFGTQDSIPRHSTILIIPPHLSVRSISALRVALNSDTCWMLHHVCCPAPSPSEAAPSVSVITNIPYRSTPNLLGPSVFLSPSLFRSIFIPLHGTAPVVKFRPTSIFLLPLFLLSVVHFVLQTNPKSRERQ